MVMKIRLFVYIGILILLSFSTLPLEVYGNPARNLCINIDWIPNVEFAGIFYAQKNGYYKEKGLNVKILSRKIMKDDVADNIDAVTFDNVENLVSTDWVYVFNEAVLLPTAMFLVSCEAVYEFKLVLSQLPL